MTTLHATCTPHAGHAESTPNRFQAAWHRALRRLQLSRLIGALNRLTPDQLEQIGVKKADIPAYALSLLDRED
ncbi:MAG: hypothetical protein KDE22_14935 [Rhodobacterales bacterium]|nr:hypothetical protein [Rhodobacterales bacterium]